MFTRFAFRIEFALLLLSIGGLSCWGQQKINPQNQVSWPANCTGSSMVYVPTLNQCIANGTAANPGGISGNFQFNNNGVMGGSANSFLDSLGNAQLQTLLASINRIINVEAYPYLAKKDCTTDNGTALNQAFADALTQNATVYFPSTGSGCFLTSTIVWKGQHFFGAGIDRTNIYGKPGQDVFQTPDNNSFSMVASPTVHDLTIGVDASVNAAATAAGGNNTFPNRVAGTVQGLTTFSTVPIVPGQWAIGQSTCAGKGFNTTASSTTVSLTLCALAYQFGSMDPALTTNVPITITNGNGVGSDYTGTLLGVSSGCTGGATCQFTVSPAPTATVTNATGKMMNAPLPPWYFGNAGFALQCSNGANCIANASGMNFTNIRFVEINSGGKLALNHATGIFTQLAPYASHFHSLIFFQLYGGYIEVPSFTGRIVTADTSSFKDIDIFQAFIPMTTYNGNDRDLTNINIYAELPGNLGPFFLTNNQTLGQSGNNIWTINSIYMEGSAGQLGEVARFQSGYYNVKGANMFAGFQGLTWIEWAASASSWDGQSPGFKIDGNSNTFTNMWTAPVAIVDNGFANEIKSTYQPGIPYYQARRSCIGKACRNPINTIDGSFITAGNNSTPFTSTSDTFFLCNDFGLPMNPAGSTTVTCVSDSTTTQPWHSYMQSAGPTTTLDFLNNGGAANIWSGQGGARLFGTHLPQTTGTTYVIGQCVGAATCSTTMLVKDGTANSTITTSPTLNFTSAGATQSFATNLSSTTFGNALDYRFQSWVNTGTNYRILAIWFAADNTDEHTWLATNGLPTPGGNKLMANTAAARLCSGGSSGFTAGHIITATGTNSACDLQDSGSTLTGLAPLASPTFTGTPAAPTPASTDNSTKIATTAYVKSAVMLTVSTSITPAAATASLCAEQTFTFTGLVAGKPLTAVLAPASLGSHLWIGNLRPGANALVIAFCADATGGTPPSGTWTIGQVQ